MSGQKRMQGPGGRGFGHGAALMMAGQKAKNFKGTLRRLLALFKTVSPATFRRHRCCDVEHRFHDRRTEIDRRCDHENI